MKQKKQTTDKPQIGRFTFGLGRQKAIVFDNLSMLLSANIDLVMALRSLRSEISGKYATIYIEFLQEQVESGVPLWQAMERCELLPKHLLSIVRIGEESGQLIGNLKLIISQRERQNNFQSQLRSAMVYPLFIITIMLVIVTGVSIFVLPRLASLYSGLKVEVPFLTKVFIAWGVFLEKYWFVAIPVIFITLAAIVNYGFINPRTKWTGQKLMFKVSITHRLIQEMELSQFGYLLGGLLQNGFPIVSALQALKFSTDFYLYRDFYEHLLSEIEEGISVQKAFTSYPQINRLIPPSFQQMLATSELSGNFADVLLKIGEIYAARNVITMKNLTVMVEPILLIIVWGGIAVFALSVILPIYGFTGSVANF